MIGVTKGIFGFAAAGLFACAGCAAEVQTPAQRVAANSDEAKPQAETVAESDEITEPEEPQRRTVFYRADAAPAEIPPVELSKGHEAMCKVKVGDTMPDMELAQLAGAAEPIKLSALFGDGATVVVFWKGNRRMSREQLADIEPDVVEPFGKAEVAVVGIVVGESASDAQAALKAAKADFPNLLDADGDAFAKVGSEKLPRTYLLDPQGKILWFDIEYSHSTRRELHQALRAVAGDPAGVGAKQE